MIIYAVASIAMQLERKLDAVCKLHTKLHGGSHSDHPDRHVTPTAAPTPEACSIAVLRRTPGRCAQGKALANKLGLCFVS